eukprot:4091234-Prymnesium_polylepis.1
MRLTVRHEMGRHAELFRKHPEALVDNVCAILDEVLNLELQAILGVYALLYERLSQNGASKLDRAVLVDRAAILRLRSALQKHVDTSELLPTKASTESGPLKAVGRGGSSVRWALNDERETSFRQKSSRLCAHAVEHLRGSVQAIEEQQRLQQQQTEQQKKQALDSVSDKATAARRRPGRYQLSLPTQVRSNANPTHPAKPASTNLSLLLTAVCAASQSLPRHSEELSSSDIVNHPSTENNAVHLLKSTGARLTFLEGSARSSNGQHEDASSFTTGQPASRESSGELQSSSEGTAARLGLKSARRMGVVTTLLERRGSRPRSSPMMLRAATIKNMIAEPGIGLADIRHDRAYTHHRLLTLLTVPSLTGIAHAGQLSGPEVRPRLTFYTNSPLVGGSELFDVISGKTHLVPSRAASPPPPVICRKLCCFHPSFVANCAACRRPNLVSCCGIAARVPEPKPPAFWIHHAAEASATTETTSHVVGLQRMKTHRPVWALLAASL